jgi:hypothetical protein
MKINSLDQILERVRDMREREWNFFKRKEGCHVIRDRFSGKTLGALSSPLLFYKIE